MGRKPRSRTRPAPAPARDTKPPAAPPVLAGTTQPAVEHALFFTALVLLTLVYLVLKSYGFHPYAGDEHIYLYQGLLVADGVVPYRDFALAHPPLQALFTALVWKLAGVDFLVGRCLPVAFCLAAGWLIALAARREFGALGGVLAAGLFLLAYEPLRSSTHFTGVNMTMAFLALALLLDRRGSPAAAALACVAAVFTRLYAIPAVLALCLARLLYRPRQGLVMIGVGAGVGLVSFVALGVSCGFGSVVDNIFAYHAQKTAMDEGTLATMRDTVLFHNADLAALFGLALVALPVSIIGDLRGPVRRTWRRVVEAVFAPGTGLAVTGALMALFLLGILLQLDRVWMYYFVPAFPFAAICGAWLVARLAGGLAGWVRDRGRLPAGPVRRARFAGLAVTLVFAGLVALAPRLEARLGYYQREIDLPVDGRTHRYTWRASPLLPPGIDALVRATFWQDQRTIGERYSRFHYLLWHESRALDEIAGVVDEVRARTGPADRLFGDSGTVPLVALLADRRIAADEVDTNIQRWKSGQADPATLVRRIDRPSTRLIVLRPRFGVGGLPAIRRLVEEKYGKVMTFRSDEGKVLELWERKP